MARKSQAIAPAGQPGSRKPEASPDEVARALRRTASKSQPENRQDTSLSKPDGNKDAFAAMLRRAVPDERKSLDPDQSTE
ncbi:MAG: hypothetical protein F4092_03720 [Rhodospirillaceae bacterium]|nr:hypothetical protein [Rhodospirillaceae bacterium]